MLAIVDKEVDEAIYSVFGKYQIDEMTQDSKDAHDQLTWFALAKRNDPPGSLERYGLEEQVDPPRCDTPMYFPPTPPNSPSMQSQFFPNAEENACIPPPKKMRRFTK